jgi:hypothetical protein
MADKENKETKAAAVRAAEVNSLNDSSEETIIDVNTLDPSMHYRRVQERPQRISRMLAKGYRFVSASEDGVQTVTKEINGADDKIRDGDTVLMAIPKQHYLERKAKRDRLSQARLSAPKGQFRKKAERHNVTVDDKE